MEDKIPFNKPYMTGKELSYIESAHSAGRLAGDGEYTKRCGVYLENKVNTARALLTHSCTAALEMQSLLLDIKPGDEVIMPSFTFVSTANAVVLRGGTPVFVDIRADTLNIDETLIEAAITPRTRAVAPVHYAGVACEMDSIMTLARSRNLAVIEDAAQGYLSRYKGVPLGSIGHLGAYSFHETKNVISGEGGALLVNAPEYLERAEIIREKGTDRIRFFRGEVDKYTWQSVGSSYLPGEIIAAFLWAQLERDEEITAKRLESWAYYHELLEPLERAERLRRPVIPAYCEHNAHMYYLLLPLKTDRQKLLNHLKNNGVHATFHYIPLHSSPAGQKYGRVSGSMSRVDDLSGRLLRLPMFYDLSPTDQEKICDLLADFLK